MSTIQINIADAEKFIGKEKFESIRPAALQGIANLNENKGAGNDFHGWVNLPSEIDRAQIDDIKATADKLRKAVDYVVCIGIGGSYLGAKAVIEALQNSFAAYEPKGEWPKVLFAGQNIGEDYR